MILNSKHMDMLMSREEQEKEIQRIQDAPKGTELYSIGTAANADKIETLLHNSQVCYVIQVANATATYVKD